MSPQEADVPALFPAGQQHPRGLHHGSVQPARGELRHPPRRLADGEGGSPRGRRSPSRAGQLVTPLLSSEQADRRADRARHHHHHGGRGRAGVPGGLQAGVGVPGPQLLPQQQPLPVRLPAAPRPAPATPHLPGRTHSPGAGQVGDPQGSQGVPPSSRRQPPWGDARGTHEQGGGRAGGAALAVGVRKRSRVPRRSRRVVGQRGTGSFLRPPPWHRAAAAIPLGPTEMFWGARGG